MFGREYLDWCDETRAANAIDAFLAEMPAEDRKWALAVLRKRHVTYRDRPQFSPPTPPSLLSQLALQGRSANQHQNSCGHVGLLGGALNSLGL